MATSQLVSAAQVIEPIDIVAGDTVGVDSFGTTTTRAVKWIVTATDDPLTVCQSSEVLAVHDGTSVLHTEYAIIGGPINYEIDVVLSGGQIILQITNNTAGVLKISGASIETRI